MKKEEIKYIKFTPGGNDTALVIDNNYSKTDKKIINDYILGFDKSIEQVGFIRNDIYQLDMAGGEFCGNATRSATMYYLNGKQGKIKIKINDYLLDSGIDEEGNCYTEIPLIKNKTQLIELDKNIYQVKLDGIVFILIENDLSKKLLKSKKNIKKYSMSLINKYKLTKYKASGVIYIEEDKCINIKPIVYVKDINTCFSETACGSGTAAVGILKSSLSKESLELEIIQPSGKIIKVKTEYDDYVRRVEIKGKVESTLKFKKIK